MALTELFEVDPHNMHKNITIINLKGKALKTALPVITHFIILHISNAASSSKFTLSTILLIHSKIL